MTNPFENEDIRREIFKYLRVPCEYKKPTHYECMKPFCFGVQHEEFHPLNVLLFLKLETFSTGSHLFDITNTYDTTLGDYIHYDEDGEEDDERFEVLYYYRDMSIDEFRDNYC